MKETLFLSIAVLLHAGRTSASVFRIEQPERPGECEVTCKLVFEPSHMST
jgi:hypothetical protein